MNPAMLKLMKAKKKRAVDPNAPPRPNLMSHDKVIRGQATQVQYMQQEIDRLKAQVESMSTKLTYQTQYLAQLHATLKK